MISISFTLFCSSEQRVTLYLSLPFPQQSVIKLALSKINFPLMVLPHHTLTKLQCLLQNPMKRTQPLRSESEFRICPLLMMWHLKKAQPVQFPPSQNKVFPGIPSFCLKRLSFIPLLRSTMKKNVMH